MWCRQVFGVGTGDTDSTSQQQITGRDVEIFSCKKRLPKNKEYNLRISIQNVSTSNCLAKHMLYLTR